jgi:hypothetical protein
MMKKCFCAACAVASLTLAVSAQKTKFYPDDPIAAVPSTQDASKVVAKEINLAYDATVNLFSRPGDPDMDRRAMSVNTIDEVPDSMWFTNRIIGSRPMTVEEVAKGPDTAEGPAPGKWTIASGKSNGVTPGFTILDANQVRWFIKFDPPDYPELMSGAEAAVTKLFHALGYNVPENHVTALTRDMLVLTERSKITQRDGSERRLREADIDRLLRMASRSADGSYRVIASRAVDGKPIGPFMYAGTRPDDPNDIIPHEHRRELRALRVFSAWTNHVDTKAINSLDTLVTRDGRQVVRHYLIDFGSTLGSASVKPRDYDEGHEYIVDPGETLKGIVSFGLYVPSWHRVDYPDIPAAGRFTAEGFDPLEWKPRIPNPAFLRARPDDTFWAARRVMAFTDEMIRAAVKTGKYTSATAEKHIADTLIARRDAIGRTWLTNVNPVVDPVLDGSTLKFQNAATAAGVVKQRTSYEIAWFTFDNATGATAPIGQPVRAEGEQAPAPDGLPSGEGAFVRVDIKAVNAPQPSWTVPVHAYFKRTGSGWTLVGFERLPDGPVASGTK